MQLPSQTYPKQHTRNWIIQWSFRKGWFALLLILGIIPLINAQSSGIRGGVNSYPYNQPEQSPTQLVDRVEDYITVDAKVELRVKPDQIRIVLAVADVGETSSVCESKVFAKLKQLKSDLVEIGIQESNLVDDFIAVLPQYKYVIQTLEGEKVAVETLVDYSMQSNLHILVPDDELAMKAIRTAFKLNVTDVIAFDYWSKELDTVKQQALESALAQAKKKSDLLLGQMFEQRPKPINVKSSTQVHMPSSMYESVNNVQAQTMTQAYRRNDLPVIKAFRPKNTYYKGNLNRFSDVQPKTVPMNCEISVVASVQLHFASPVSRRLIEHQSASREASQTNRESPNPELNRSVR